MALEYVRSWRPGISLKVGGVFLAKFNGGKLCSLLLLILHPQVSEGTVGPAQELGNLDCSSSSAENRKLLKCRVSDSLLGK
jgi:hypothetical protein